MGVMRMLREVENLDAWINKISYQLVKKIKQEDKSKYKNEIDKALGVLSNDGVYAYYVYARAKKIDKIFINEIQEIKRFVSVKGVKDTQGLNQDYFEKLSQDLPSLLFFREILEKILIYARYHAKAMEDNNE